VRVVVTEARQGQSVIGKDSDVGPAAAPGMRLGLLWGSDDAPPEVPGTENEASAGPDGYFPSVGGYRATLVEFDPSPALTTTDGLHQADTVDVVWIISGRSHSSHWRQSPVAQPHGHRRESRIRNAWRSAARVGRRCNRRSLTRDAVAGEEGGHGKQCRFWPPRSGASPIPGSRFRM
jgi:hypothetical protein